MKQKLYFLLLTAVFGLFGLSAWAQDLPITVIDGTEYYEIGNADDLVKFAQIVNGGELTGKNENAHKIHIADFVSVLNLMAEQ